jgi:hypothetical protein
MDSKLSPPISHDAWTLTMMNPSPITTCHHLSPPVKMAKTQLVWPKSSVRPFWQSQRLPRVMAGSYPYLLPPVTTCHHLSPPVKMMKTQLVCPKSSVTPFWESQRLPRLIAGVILSLVTTSHHLLPSVTTCQNCKNSTIMPQIKCDTILAIPEATKIDSRGHTLTCHHLSPPVTTSHHLSKFQKLNCNGPNQV